MKPFSSSPKCSLALLFRLSILIFSVFLATSHICPTKAFAAQASLSWNAPTTYTDGTPLTSLSGYRIYTGTASGSYSQNIDVGNSTSYTLSSLNDGTTYYFAVMAYDASGYSSGFSNQVTYTTPAAAPSATLYTLTTSAGSGGSITPSGSVVVSKGTNQTFAITPNTGYKIANVTVDGVSVGTVSTYTFSNVAANHTISASFTANTSSYSISASAGTGGSISPNSTVNVNSGASQTFTITPASGYKISGVSVDGVSVGAVSSYTFSNVTANHTIAASFASSSTSNVVFADNSGGSQYTDLTGVTYQADSKYSGGNVSTTTAAIGGTTDDTLYQSERYGNFSYNIPLANGNYSVTLKFAEIYWSAPGKRVFSVNINGQTVVSNLDLYAKVGKNAAYDVVIPVSVTNGALSIQFISQVNYAKISAIKVVPSSTGQVVFADNGGGSKFASSTGTTYQADSKFSGGNVSTTTAAIGGTTDDTLYQSERYGNFSYNVPLANGNYSVTLKFAEIYWSAPGKRVFSVNINGQTVVSNLDLYAKVGKNAAYDVVIPVSVTNGALSIQFISQVDYAKISAILVKTT